MPGVIEVNTIGGYEQQFHVTPDPARLLAYGLTFRDVMAALERNNANVGAGYIERNGEQYLVRAPGQVAQHRRDPRHRRRHARRRADPHRRRGRGAGWARSCAPAPPPTNGEEVVLGTAMHADRREQPRRSRSAWRRGSTRSRRRCPTASWRARSTTAPQLVDATIATVEKNLLEGALLVVVVLFLLLGNFRAAFVTACVIPLSMLFTITGMVESRISGNLMSLGALDFGLIVDGAVIIVENCLRRLAEEQHRRGRLLTRARALRDDPRRRAARSSGRACSAR